ncbi:hypothetical protein ACWD4J_42755 [Streptomyces sp. NPDC002577]
MSRFLSADVPAGAGSATPGAPTALLVRADELRQVEGEQRIPYTQMLPYVGLADGTVVHADRSVPLA